MGKKQSIPDSIRQEVVKNSMKDGLIYCYITEEPVTEYELDHLIPEALGGSTTVDNLRVVDKKLNRRKGTMSLTDFKYKYELEKLLYRDTITLDDILTLKRIGRIKPMIKIGNSTVSISVGDTNYNHELYECSVTKSKYFYAKLPVSIIKNDSGGLQPRTIDKKKVIDLSLNLNHRPQLLPSIARLTSDSILLFDGQHKLAANVLNNRHEVDLKIYVDKEGLYDALMITNLEAHTKFRQTPFLSGVLSSKMNSVFKEHLQEYCSIDRVEYTEVGFVEWLVKSKGYSNREAKELFVKSITDDLVSVMDIKEVTHKNLDNFIKGLLGTEILNPQFSIENNSRDVIRNNVEYISTVLKKYVDTERFHSRGVINFLTMMVRDFLCVIHNTVSTADRNNVIKYELTPDKKDTLERYMSTLMKHPAWIDVAHPLVNNGSNQDFLNLGITLNYVINNS